MQKLKEVVRYELTGRGALPNTFQTYVAAAIAVESNHEFFVIDGVNLIQHWKTCRNSNRLDGGRLEGRVVMR